MEYHTEYSILCSEGPKMVSCVQMEKVEFHLDTACKPPKIIVFTPHERFVSSTASSNVKLIKI
jgi:hypothetical protein